MSARAVNDTMRLLKWMICGTCLILPWAVAKDYYVSQQGDDGNSGSSSLPFATIQQAAAVMQAGDVCYIHAGRYAESVTLRKSGKKGERIRFVAVQPGTVTIDGTDVISKPWQKHRGNIYKVRLPGPTEQVFYQSKPMTWARWPNMTYSENWQDDKKWARSEEGSRPGEIRCAELSELNQRDLSGAYCFLKYAKGNNTFSRPITKWSPDQGRLQWDDRGFYENKMTAEDGPSGSPKLKQEILQRVLRNNEFYLAGSLELLDTQEEWFFNPDDSSLYLMLPDGILPPAGSVRVKSRDLGMRGENLEYVSVEGIDFFGCSLNFGGICQRIELTQCRFYYPDEELFFPDRKAVKESYPIQPVSIAGVNCTVRKCLIDGSARSSLSMVGGGHEVLDCVVTEGNRHGRHDDKAIEVAYRANAIRLHWKEKKVRQLEKERGKNLVKHCTVYNNGGIAVYLLGSSPQHGGGNIAYNHLFNNNRYCVDISSIYVPMGNRWQGGAFHHNWIHNVNGLAYRVDIMGEDVVYHHNVTWETGSGYEAEGYSYKVFNNTTLLPNRESWHQVIISQHRFLGIEDESKHDYTFPTVTEWLICNNLAYQYTDRVSLRELPKFRESRQKKILAKGRGKSFQQALKLGVGNIHHNYVIENPADLFVSVESDTLDLRPKKGSPLVDAGSVIDGVAEPFSGKAPDIGAYEYGGDYWYPGATWMPDGLPVPTTMAEANQLARRLQKGTSFAGKKQNVIELTH